MAQFGLSSEILDLKEIIIQSGRYLARNDLENTVLISISV